jgi:hypothetical protein
MGTQRQNEDKENKKIQHRKLNMWETRTQPKPGTELRCSQSVGNSCFLKNTRQFRLYNKYSWNDTNVSKYKWIR